MHVNRQPISRRSRSQDPLDRRVDKLIETGRQFVDGVSGNRPGQRKQANLGSNRSGFENVGRWVGEKLDWFFEEEDDWMEDSDLDLHPEDSSLRKKKPLQAISLRMPKAIASTAKSKELDSSDLWPDESSFKIDRWQRPQNERKAKSAEDFMPQNQREDSFTRPLPKSSRRKTN